MSTDEPPEARPEPESEAQPSDETEHLSTQNLYQLFLGTVQAPGSNFGIGGATESTGEPGRSLRRTGPLEESEIQEALDYYLPPHCFSEALTIVNERGLVVLRGPDGTGKRASAIAILREDELSRPLIGLSPGLSASELLRYPFRERHGYLVQDRVSAGDAPETLAYDFAELSRELIRSEARLVITSTAPPRELPEGLFVDWSVPKPAELANACLSDLELAPQDRVRVKRALAYSTPRQIVAVAKELARTGVDAATVTDLLERTSRQTIAGWFDGEPAEGDVLLVAALCFASELTEARFEEMLARLEAYVYTAASTDADPDHELTNSGTTLSQRRRTRIQSVPFLTRTDVRDESSRGIREQRLTLTSEDLREWVLVELWERYDRALWEPVRQWLHESFPHADTRHSLSVARGLATLALAAPELVRAAYLNPWASSAPAQRRTACYTVWHAAFDDALASWALETALTWARADEASQLTAILCLSGPVGLRFPAEAMRQLWRLARRAGQASHTAQEAIVTLINGSLTGPDKDVTGLNFLAGKLSDGNRDQQRLAFAVIDRLMLSVTPHDDSLLLLAAQRDGPVNSLGTIWAKTLINRRHRGTAMRALAKTISALQRDEPDLRMVRRLGTAIVRRMPSSEVLLLERELVHQIALSKRAAGTDARSIVRALLGSSSDPTQIDQEEPREPIPDR
jgi:hypothetical protein